MIGTQENVFKVFYFYNRLKEQLIRELVKSGKDAELMNKQYAEKIKALEKVCIGNVGYLYDYLVTHPSNTDGVRDAMVSTWVYNP